MNTIFDAANKPNTKRINSTKFQTKLVLFCMLAQTYFRKQALVLIFYSTLDLIAPITYIKQKIRENIVHTVLVLHKYAPN